MAALVTGALGSLLPKLAELAKKEYGLQKGVKKKIDKLSRELTLVHAVLRKIGDVPPDQLDELVRLWASEVREASYDMEDIVDTFLVCFDAPEPATEPHMLRRLRKKMSSLFKKGKARHNISSLIDEINEKLEEVAARRGRYTLDSIVANPVAATAIDPRIFHLYKTVTELAGIEGPRDELINKLSLGDGNVDLSSTTKMKILSIVGFGGLGKTTLAKVVYDHLKPRFKYWAFVPVGRNPDIKKVFRDILIALDEKAYTYTKLKGLDENQLMGKLHEFIREKRCLIVIDDIWDKVTWNSLRCALQESNCGSRLVITTRISEVAAYAGEIYKMQPLSHDNSEKLLYARIADGEGKHFDSPSAEACEKILRKCGGVPLAIITIASLLASKPGQDWSEVYNSIGFGHKSNDEVDNTRKILSFSYYDLPSHLKTCLLYLSIFPEDHVIQKNSLIWMWVAEGFVALEQAEPGLGLFELGERYFDELINRSMIQPWETDEGYIDACSVHDMVLDLILKLSREQNFVSILNGGERQKPQGSISRRVALQSVEEHNVGQLANIPVDKVRSIFASQCYFCALCPRLPFLRVVEMVICSVLDEDCGEDLSEDYLASLLHLRYLKLAGTFEHIPWNVRYPRFLQTLDLLETRIQELPEEVALLKQLVCLRLKSYSRLVLRPRASQKKKSYSETSVPAGLIGKLTSLQELCINEVNGDVAMQFVKELGLLTELRVLKAMIRGGSDCIESALLESLGHLHNIQEIEIYGSSGCEHPVSADAGWHCQHLRFLDLNYLVFSGLPAWINSSLAPNLSYLDVLVVVLKDQDMETLAKLPELSCLKLKSESDTKSVVSIKIRTDEGVGYFRKLRFLKIGARDGLSIWFDLRGNECNSSKVASSNTIMPSLESLEFDVHLRPLRDENLQLGFHELLGGFQNVGTSSLQRVRVNLSCERAGPREVEEAEAALKHAAAVHPKHPTFEIDRAREFDMMSRHQEACIEMTRAQAWKLADIIGSEHIQILRMPDPQASSSSSGPRAQLKPGQISTPPLSSRLHTCTIAAQSSIAQTCIKQFFLRTSADGARADAQACRALSPPLKSSSKVMRLLYTNNGMALLALSSNAVHKLWKWEHNGKNPRGKSAKPIPPVLWQPKKGIQMTNDTTDGNNPEEATACFALSRDDFILMSASGGQFSIFHMETLSFVRAFMAPPPAATVLAFLSPKLIVAIGREDFSICIYHYYRNEELIVLKGHRAKITGLAFSESKNVLVSSSVDAQLCVWSTDGWEKKKSSYVQTPSNLSNALIGDTSVQFHYDETHLLVVHESQLAIYDWQLECMCSWFPRDALPMPISSAVYSLLGCLLVYAGFRDGAIGIFEAESLTLQCKIAPSAYIPSSISSGETVYPTALASHPWKPNQIAVGMSDGVVLLLEPLDKDDVQVGSNADTEQCPPSDVSNSGGHS